MSWLQLLVSLLPVLSVLVLLVILRLSAIRAMLLSLLITLGGAAWVWQVPTRQLAASVLEGWIIASSILIIVFGAMAWLSGRLRSWVALHSRCLPTWSLAFWGRNSPVFWAH